MNCRDAEKIMVLSLSADVDPYNLKLLEAHLQACPACSRKYMVIKKDYEWLASLSGQRPEFDRDASWNIIRDRLAQKMWARERRIFRRRRLLPAAVALGILILGFMIGRYTLFKPSPDLSFRSHELGMGSRLIRQHLNEVGTVLLEYLNRESLETDQQILVFEMQKSRFLLFQNRTFQTLFKESDNPFIISLLMDLEIVMYETTNFEPGASETHEFIKTLLKEKGIFFRIRHMKMFPEIKMSKGASL